MNELERVAVCLGSFVRQRYQVGGQLLDNAEDGAIAGRLFRAFLAKVGHLAIERGYGQRRLL